MKSLELFKALQIVLEHYYGEEITTERLENDYSILSFVFEELEEQKEKEEEDSEN